MKKILIIFLLLSLNSFSQILGDLKYNTSNRTYIAPPISEIRSNGRIMEQRYLENQKTCNYLESEILELLASLTVDSINLKYREGLKRNLARIRFLQKKGDFANYTLILDEIIDDLNINSEYYEDENEHNNKILESKLIQKEQEIENLKKELEIQKAVHQSSRKKK